MSKLTYSVDYDTILESNTKSEVATMNKDNSNSMQLNVEDLCENVSKVLSNIETERRMQNYAEMILEKYRYDLNLKSTKQDYLLKVEDFLNYSYEWKKYREGQLLKTIHTLKEKMRMEMDEMLKKDILPYVNSKIAGYEFYLEKSEITKGRRSRKHPWGYEYKFFINVREKEEVS